jgi:UrcA family protein
MSTPKHLMIIALGALTIAAVQAADNMEEVTVTAPGAKTIGRGTTGAPIEEMSASEKIQYPHTMLMTNSGRALLEDKIAQEAKRLCQELDTPGSVNTETEQACVKRAIAGAKEQIAAAAAAQKKTG